MSVSCYVRAVRPPALTDLMVRTCILLALPLATSFAARADAQLSRGPDTVLVQSGSLELRALRWRPDGRGPFPAVLFNHGSWPGSDTPSGRRPDVRIFAQAAALGPVFAKHGYVFLFLFRRGAGLSVGQGTHGADLMAKELAANGQEALNRLQMQLLETDELNDAHAGLAFLRALPEVDSRRVAVAGHSFGGSLTLLLAERDSALAAALDFAVAAGSWASSPQLRARLLKAVGRMTVPVFFIHTENDYSVAPGKALAAEMARRGKAHRIKIYPAFGATTFEGHNIVHLSVATWEPNVFTFLDEQLRR
jgi:carboxymethylenebutenolidase